MLINNIAELFNQICLCEHRSFTVGPNLAMTLACHGTYALGMAFETNLIKECYLRRLLIVVVNAKFRAELLGKRLI